MSVADDVKAIMRQKGLSAYQLSKETGVNQTTLSRFFSGERPLVAGALHTLLDFLGYELCVRKKRKDGA